MKKYEVQFWKKEAVWCRRTVEVKTDKDVTKLSKDELQYLIAEDPDSDVDWLDGDYNWETSETLEYDFENDFEVKEVK